MYKGPERVLDTQCTILSPFAWELRTGWNRASAHHSGSTAFVPAVLVWTWPVNKPWPGMAMFQQHWYGPGQPHVNKPSLIQTDHVPLHQLQKR